jgi:hypothetical protein
MATNNRVKRAAERAKAAKAAENRAAKRARGNSNAAAPAAKRTRTAPTAAPAAPTGSPVVQMQSATTGTTSLQTANVPGTTSLQPTVVHHHHYAAAVNAAVNPLEIVKLMKELEKLLHETINKPNNKCISRQALQKIVQDLKTASHRGQLEVTINNEPSTQKKNSIRNKIGYCVNSTLGRVCLGIAGTAFTSIMEHQLTGKQSLLIGLFYGLSKIIANLQNIWAKGQLNREDAADLKAAVSAAKARWGGNSSSSSSLYIHALCGSYPIAKAIVNETINNTSTSPFFT